MANLRNTAVIVFTLIAVTLLGAVFVLGASAPTAPLTLVPGESSNMDESNIGAKQVDALAGNITFLTLTALSQTRAWQGYWGNVTGYITLDDANNFTFYNWSAAEPRGQVYASLVSSGTPDWPNVVCGLTGAGANNLASIFQTQYGINVDDYDNVTITYNRTDHPTFQIIDNDISGCPTTYIWQTDEYQSANFANFLLFDSTDDAADAWIFGTIMENDQVGTKTDIPCYNGEDCDFQLLVAEDGHGNNTAVTPYYFWVDITG